MAGKTFFFSIKFLSFDFIILAAARFFSANINAYNVLFFKGPTKRLRALPTNLNFKVGTILLSCFTLSFEVDAQSLSHPELHGLEIREVNSGRIYEMRPGGPNVGPVDRRVVLDGRPFERVSFCRSYVQVYSYQGAMPNYVGYRVVGLTDKSITYQLYIQPEHKLIGSEAKHLDIAFFAVFVDQNASTRQRELMRCSKPLVEPPHNPAPPNSTGWEPIPPTRPTPIPRAEFLRVLLLQCVEESTGRPSGRSYHLTANSNRSCGDAEQLLRSQIVNPDFCKDTGGRLGGAHHQKPNERNGSIETIPSSSCRY